MSKIDHHRRPKPPERQIYRPPKSRAPNKDENLQTPSTSPKNISNGQQENSTESNEFNRNAKQRNGRNFISSDRYSNRRNSADNFQGNHNEAPQNSSRDVRTPSSDVRHSVRSPSNEAKNSSNDVRNSSNEFRNSSNDRRNLSNDARKWSIDDRNSFNHARNSAGDGRNSANDNRNSFKDARNSFGDSRNSIVDAQNSSNDVRKSSNDVRNLSNDYQNSSNDHRKSPNFRQATDYRTSYDTRGGKIHDDIRRNHSEEPARRGNSTRKYSKQQHEPRLPKTFEESESSEIEFKTTMVIKNPKAKEADREEWRKYLSKTSTSADVVGSGAKPTMNDSSTRKIPLQNQSINDSIPRKYQTKEIDFRKAPIQNQQLTAVKENAASALNNIDDFANISWSEETERAEEEARLEAAAAANAAVDVGASSHHQRGGLIQLPAHLMNQTKDNYQKDVGKRNKPKGRGFRPNNFFVDPEYSRGPPPSVNRGVLPVQYSQDDAIGFGRGGVVGRGRSSSFDYDVVLPRPGSQPSFGSRRQTPPSVLEPSPPSTNAPEYERAKRIVEDKYLPQINRLTQDLKIQYDFASKNKPFDLAMVEAYRRKLQELYREAVMFDLMYSYRNNLEHRMWKGAFYETIEILRAYENYDLGRSERQTKQTSSMAGEMRGTLFRLLDEARDFYENLKISYQSKYDFSLVDHLRTIDDNLSNVVKPTCERLNQTLKYALLSCQRFEVALGDIERYREQLKKAEFNYQSARLYYLNAVQLGPSNGRPYNQLALLAQYTKRRLDIVFYYFRSLSVKHAFETAKDSIKTVFEEQNKKVKLHEDQLKQFMNKIEKNRRDVETDKGDKSSRIRREIWINSDGSSTTEMQKTTEIVSRNADLDWFRQTTTHDLYRRFLTYFLHLNGMLFAKINMDQFELMAEKCLVQFRELLSREESPLTPMQLVQIVIICFYNVHHSATKELERDTYSLLQHNAVQLCLSIFGLLMERLEILYKKNHPNTFRFDAHLHLILPALRLFSTYLCNSDAYKCVSLVGYLGGIETPRFCVNIWTHLANVCNAIDKSKFDKTIVVAVQQPLVPGTKPVLFPEDYSCSPMFNIFSSKLVPVNLPEGFAEDYSIDCARLDTILQLGMYLDGVNSTVLSYDMDDKCYIAMNAVRSASPEPVHRRLAASDDESESASNKNGPLNSFVEYESSTNEEMKQLRMQRRDEESKQKLLEQEQCRIVLNVCPKYLIPDTNSFIEHLNLIRRVYQTEKYTFAVPLVVVNELIGLKKHPDSEWVASQAVEALKYAEEWSNDGSKRFQVLTTDGNFLTSLMYLNESTSTRETNDDRILKCCCSLINDGGNNRSDIRNLKDEPLTLHRNMVLLTDDRNLRVKALGRDVPVRSVPHFVAWTKV